MGLFDFFKRKGKKADDKSEFARQAILPNEQDEFTLRVPDFGEKFHRTELLAGVWIDPEFVKEINGLTKGEHKPL